MSDKIVHPGTQLYRQGRFLDAAEAYRARISAGAATAVDINGLANSLLALRRYADAIPLLAEAGAIDRQAIPTSMGQDAAIAVCMWLAESRERGLELMRGFVEGLERGTIAYANDLVGGLKQGLQLHYMAVTAGDNEQRAFALAFVRKLSLSARGKHWPGPVGRLVLGLESLDEVMMAATGVVDVAEGMALARTDLMKRRKLVNAFFGAATAWRMVGDESRCLGLMRTCASLENPLIEPDWHLAYGESSVAMAN